MKTSKNIISFLILFLMISCALESQYSLPNDELINPDIIGEWYPEKNNNETISILKNDDKTYRLIIKEDEEIEELKSFSKNIKGYSVMNVITESNGKLKNAFYGFNVQGNILTFSEVNDKLRNEDFESESELLQFFEDNIESDDFFINESSLIRK